MRGALTDILTEHSEQLVQQLQVAQKDLSASQQKTLQSVIFYLDANQDHMHYETYLQRGYPIGTGVIEGACRHLVKDRFEASGMHWSRAGAQAMLDLRAVYLNDDWDNFQCFRREQVHQQLYATLDAHTTCHPELACAA